MNEKYPHVGRPTNEEVKMRKDKQKLKIISIIILVIGLGLAIYGGVNYIKEKLSNDDNQVIDGNESPYEEDGFNIIASGEVASGETSNKLPLILDSYGYYFTKNNKNSTTYLNKTKHTVNAIFKAGAKTYYYKWKTYRSSDGKKFTLNWNKDSCHKITNSTKTSRDLSFDTSSLRYRYGEFVIYSDSSCKKKVETYTTKTYVYSKVKENTSTKQKTFTVTFNKNTASKIGKSKLSCKGTTSCQATLPTITAKSGYEVVGWSTNKNATSGVKPGAKITLTSNKTYYAITKKKSQSVTNTIFKVEVNSGFKQLTTHTSKAVIIERNYYKPFLLAPEGVYYKVTGYWLHKASSTDKGTTEKIIDNTCHNESMDLNNYQLFSNKYYSNYYNSIYYDVDVYSNSSCTKKLITYKTPTYESHTLKYAVDNNDIELELFDPPAITKDGTKKYMKVGNPYNAFISMSINNTYEYDKVYYRYEILSSSDYEIDKNIKNKKSSSCTRNETLHELIMIELKGNYFNYRYNKIKLSLYTDSSCKNALASSSGKKVTYETPIFRYK